MDPTITLRSVSGQIHISRDFPRGEGGKVGAGEGPVPCSSVKRTGFGESREQTSMFLWWSNMHAGSCFEPLLCISACKYRSGSKWQSDS